MILANQYLKFEKNAPNASNRTLYFQEVAKAFIKFLFLVAQWSRRLATNQKIPGSSPGGEEFFFKNVLLFFEY